MILHFPFLRATQTPSDERRVAVAIEPIESHAKGKAMMHTHVALTRRQIESILKNAPNLSEGKAREYKDILKRMPH